MAFPTMPAASGPHLNVASDDTAAALQKKLQTVGLKQREQVAATIAAESGVPYIDLKNFPISQEALQMVPEEQAITAKAFVFFSTPEDARIAAVDPKSQTVLELMHQLEERHHVKIARYQISEESLRIALDRYATLPKIQEFKDE